MEQSPKLDGSLDEAAWRGAAVVSQFIQRDPREGEPASEKTEVRIVYNDRAIFFGIVCYDSESAKIIAKERRRDDFLQGDDTFELILDPFRSRKDGFLFRINPLGTQFDAWYGDEGRRENSSWDERWRTATRITEDGWIAEIEIPFKSVRMPDKKTQVWGIDFRRKIVRKNEEAIWSNFKRDFSFVEVSQSGDLVGLENIAGDLRLRVKPYVAVGASRIFTGMEPRTKHLFDVGLEDVKYRIIPSLTLDFTAKPDFAQVDVDEQVVNLTRFPILFPEKREFFLENSNVFEFGPGASLRQDQRPDLKFFHSRVIGFSEDREPVDILAGAKLTGKLEGFDLGLLNAQTDDFQDRTGSNYSVLRVKRSALSRSVVGGIFTNRQSHVKGDYNRTFGLDSNFIFFDNLHLESFFLNSKTKELEGDTRALRPLRVFWKSDFLFVNADHMIIGRDFQTDVGFVPRKNVKQSDLEFQINPRPASKTIRQLELGARLRYIPNQQNVLETRERELSFGLLFQSGDQLRFSYLNGFEFLERPFRLRGRTPVPAGTYGSDQFQWHFIAYRGRKVSGFFQFQRATGFWGGNRNTLNINPRISWSQHLSMNFQYRLDHVDLPTGGFSSSVSNLRVNYNFSNRWLTSTAVQHDSIQDLFSVNFRLNFIYRPGDDLFLVYNETRRPGNADRAIILKFTHSFDF